MDAATAKLIQRMDVVEQSIQGLETKVKDLEKTNGELTSEISSLQAKLARARRKKTEA